MNQNWLLRAARWVRRPPSMGQVKFLLVIVAICLGLFAVERTVGWPEALTPHKGAPGRVAR